MLTDDLSLNPSQGIAAATNAAKTFRLRNIDSGNSERVDSSSTIGAPHVLSISHQKSGSGDKTVDRHMVRVDRTFPATETTPEVTLSVYLVMVVPRSGVTLQNVIDGIGYVVDVFNETDATAKITNGES
jgi:hypothetical protein